MKSNKHGSSQQSSASSQSIKHERRNILRRDSAFSMSEEYKALRANIMFSTTTDGCKIIGITSAEAGDGKSITALNVSIAFAQAQLRVLLVDCDLRMPKIARLLGGNASPGISNLLVNMSTVSDVIHHVKTDTTVLDVIYSGDIPPNPSELLSSNRLTLLLGELSQSYDYIIIDTPPVTVVSDAVILSTKITGMVVVVRATKTHQPLLTAALNQLSFASANVLGFVLNGIPYKEGRKYKYYNKYNRYGYRKYGYGYGYSYASEHDQQINNTSDRIKK